MADATTLWMPPTLEDRARITSNHSALLPPAARTLSTFRAAVWLPVSETDVMRECLYRLTGPQAHVTRRALERAARSGKSSGSGSAFEPDAVYPVGATGLWRLMPPWRAAWG